MRTRFTITLSGDEGPAFKRFCQVVGHSEKEIARVAIMQYMSTIIKEAQRMQEEHDAGNGTQGNLAGLGQASPSSHAVEASV